MSKSLRVLCYNIHKGFSTTRRQFVLDKIKRALESVQPDLVFLQEVLGHHEKHAKRVKEWPLESQFEFLADKMWPHFAYGRNAIYYSGHHGNALLSRYPIHEWSNYDLSTNPLESRGMLHAIIEVPGFDSKIHCICVHLNILKRSRSLQLKKICDRISATVPKKERLLLAGDFNDWSGQATALLADQLSLKEVFHTAVGKHAATFPARFPLLSLDRIYFRGFGIKAADVPQGALWERLSDHAPLLAELKP